MIVVGDLPLNWPAGRQKRTQLVSQSSRQRLVAAQHSMQSWHRMHGMSINAPRFGMQHADPLGYNVWVGYLPVNIESTMSGTKKMQPARTAWIRKPMMA